MKARRSAAPLTLWLVVLALPACGPAPAPEPPEAAVVLGPSPGERVRATRQFEELREGFFPWYFEAQPVRSTELGRAEYAERYPDMRPAAVQERIDRYLDWLAELEKIPFTHLEEGPGRYDYAVLEYALRSELLELEETRNWVRNPHYYTRLVSRGIAAVLEGGIPPESREAALRARLEAAPSVLAAASENLRSPPVLWTDLAVREARELIRFLEDELAGALAGSGPGSADLPIPLVGPRDRLVERLEAHLRWLEEDLRARSTGDFRLGRYLLERKLLYDEHVALGVDELEAINERAIEEFTAAARTVAAEVDADRSLEAIMDSISREGPAPDSLLPLTRQVVAALGDWVRSARIAPVPEHEGVIVRYAPAYATGDPVTLTGAGPYGAGPVYLNLMRPRQTGDDWTPGGYAYVDILAIVAHQAMPGRFLQRLHQRDTEGQVRRVFAPRTFTKGWAHYAEQLVHEAGYTRGDPALRLGQLRRALEQHARWYASLHLHARGASIDEVIDRFAEIAFVPEAVARREVLRATHDPNYLHAALGRLQINELRRDYAEYLEGKDETLELYAFNEQLLDLVLPLPLAREALIPEPDAGSRRLQLIQPAR